MKTTAPSLSPLLRTDAQGLIMAALYLNPEREYSVSELAKIGGVSIPTGTREVDRLHDANFVVSRRVGPSRLVKANVDHAIYAAVRGIVLYAYGPVAVITPMIAGLEGLVAAFVYGSWAARLQGEPGPEPIDIDVLLIGDVSSRASSRIAAKAAEQLGRTVSVHNLSEDDWLKAESGFVKTIKARPHIALEIRD